MLDKDCEIVGVVKANAYGHGSVEVASYFESIWNEGNYNVVEMEKAYNSVDTWDEPYEYDKAEGKEFVERVNDLMPVLKGE